MPFDAIYENIAGKTMVSNATAMRSQRGKLRFES